MKMRQLTWIVIALNFLIAACTSTQAALSENVATPSQGTEPSVSKLNTDRKILYSANLTLIVENPDSVTRKVIQIAKSFDGYMSAMESYYIEVKIKSEHLDTILDEVAQLGKVTKRNVTGVDVSEEYYDYQVRLENAQKARDRYLELLAKAEDVSGALLVEKELERLNGIIDMIQGRLNRINHLDEFSVVSVYLKTKVKPGILGYLGLGLFKGISWLFVRK